MSMIKYRPEIDGLRTIAVLAVIIYHADFCFGSHHILKGGFLGVDIFFVISGFLITSILLKEINTTKKFSFLRFYDRRARRLLPVLTLVYIVFFPFAWYLLLPDSFIDFSKSIIASNIFLSNFYWYDSLQIYGAEASNLKPFLHTWSLAVEEQYYFIFPLILLVAIRWFKLNVIALLTILILLSLQFAEVMSVKNSSFSFYLLMSRFWELLIGSLLAYTLSIHPAKENDTLLTKTMPSIGLYLIVYSIIFIDLNYVNHPGFITLLPVIGTTLIIWFANKDELVTKVLSSKLFVSIGLISYSLYLWHFPVFAFLRLEGLFITPLQKTTAIFAVLILSFISYKIIEQPFRSKEKVPSKIFYPLLILSILIIILVSNIIINHDGYPKRFKNTIASGQKELIEYRAKYWGDHSKYTKNSDFSKNRFSIEVIGNSYAQDIANSILENSDYEVGFSGKTGYLCRAITLNPFSHKDKRFLKWENICKNKNSKKLQRKLINTDLVIIADNRSLHQISKPKIAKEMSKNIQLLRINGYDGPILIISNRPTYKKHVFQILKEYGSVGNSVNAYAEKYRAQTIQQLLKEDNAAELFYKKHNIYYYSVVNSLCPNNECQIVYNGMPLYYDTGHFTLNGAKYIGQDLVKFINENIKDKGTYTLPK